MPNKSEIVFRGSKAFFGARNNLEIMIVEHPKHNCLELIAFNSFIQVESPRFYFYASAISNKVNKEEYESILQSKKDKFTKEKRIKDFDILGKEIWNTLRAKYILQHVENDLDIPPRTCRIYIYPPFEDVHTICHKSDSLIAYKLTTDQLSVAFPPDIIDNEIQQDHHYVIAMAAKTLRLCVEAFTYWQPDNSKLLYRYSPSRLRWINAIRKTIFRYRVMSLKKRLRVKRIVRRRSSFTDDHIGLTSISLHNNINNNSGVSPKNNTKSPKVVVGGGSMRASFRALDDSHILERTHGNYSILEETVAETEHENEHDTHDNTKDGTNCSATANNKAKKVKHKKIPNFKHKPSGISTSGAATTDSIKPHSTHLSSKPSVHEVLPKLVPHNTQNKKKVSQHKTHHTQSADSLTAAANADHDQNANNATPPTPSAGGADELDNHVNHIHGLRQVNKIGAASYRYRDSMFLDASQALNADLYRGSDRFNDITELLKNVVLPVSTLPVIDNTPDSAANSRENSRQNSISETSDSINNSNNVIKLTPLTALATTTFTLTPTADGVAGTDGNGSKSSNNSKTIESLLSPIKPPLCHNSNNSNNNSNSNSAQNSPTRPSHLSPLADHKHSHNGFHEVVHHNIDYTHTVPVLTSKSTSRPGSLPNSRPNSAGGSSHFAKVSALRTQPHAND